MEANEEVEVEVIDLEKEEESSDPQDKSQTEIEDLKKELKKAKESKKVMELEYSRCEKELKNKTEEVEKLNIELKDLKEIIALEKCANETNVEKNPKSNEEVYDERRVPKLRSTPRGVNKCSKQCQVEYNCTECFFQGSSDGELSKHINTKHRIKDSNMGGSLKCRNCGESFSSKSNLMKHRKDKHLITVAYCKNNLNARCPYSSTMCWWNHSDPDKDLSREEDGIRCFICAQTFQSEGTMMIHRKKEHKNMVRICNLFEENNCRHGEDACWYSHGEIDEEDAEKQQSSSVFCKVQQNKEPPLEDLNQKKNQQKEHSVGNK
jgi:hypothetical protein